MSDRNNTEEKSSRQNQPADSGPRERSGGRSGSSRYDRDSDRSDSRSGGPRGRGKVYFKKKVCRFCTQNVPLDYKNPESLWRFLTDRGKILPRRITGTCSKHQRELSRQVKRARILALIPFVKH